jgi:PAS domain-containing protein
LAAERSEMERRKKKASVRMNGVYATTNTRLNGWKEIAGYIGKSSRTAQRWEEEFELPVHRIGGGNREIVFAFREEINEWQNSTERLRFESLLADISARFINLNPADVDHEIKNALGAICGCFGLDHATFWQVTTANPRSLVLTHIVRDPELPIIATLSQARSVAPWSSRRLLANEIVYVPDTANPPADVEARSKERWRELGIKSILAFPLSVGGRTPIGAIAFGSTRKRRDWPERMQKRLRLLAEVFANALDRKESERKLREDELRLKLAAEAAGVGFFALDSSTGKMWASDILLKLAGLQAGQALNLSRVISRAHPEDRDAIQDAISLTMRTGQEVSTSCRFVFPDGSLHRMMLRGCRYGYSPEGRALLMGVTFEIK